MSIALGYYNGPQLKMENKPKPYAQDELRMLRALDMLKRKLSGWPTKQIASYFRISPRYVNMEIADIPPAIRSQVEKGGE